jgi:hypothetical protein
MPALPLHKSTYACRIILLAIQRHMGGLGLPDLTGTAMQKHTAAKALTNLLAGALIGNNEWNPQACKVHFGKTAGEHKHKKNEAPGKLHKP